MVHNRISPLIPIEDEKLDDKQEQRLNSRERGSFAGDKSLYLTAHDMLAISAWTHPINSGANVQSITPASAPIVVQVARVSSYSDH